MNGGFRFHGMKKGNIVDTGPDMGKEIGDIFPAISIGLKFPFGTHHPAFISFPAAAEGFYLYGLTNQGLEFGFVIKGIHMTGTTVHEKEDYRFCLAR